MSDNNVVDAVEPLPDIQLPLIAKHPLVRLKPTLDVDVAEPFTLKPDNVVVPKPVADTLRAEDPIVISCPLLPKLNALPVSA